MRHFKTESQIWSFLADEYERGYSSEVCLRGICVSLGGVGISHKQLVVDCRARLSKRFKPQQPPWWKFWKKRLEYYQPVYYWHVDDTEARADACHKLFFEAHAEETGMTL